MNSRQKDEIAQASQFNGYTEIEIVVIPATPTVAK